MNKRVVARLRGFQAAQRRSGQYHFSQYTPHEQAIREHIARGFKEGLSRLPFLLAQDNRIA